MSSILNIALLIISIFAITKEAFSIEEARDYSNSSDDLVAFAYSEPYSEAFSNVGLLTAVVEFQGGMRQTIKACSAVYLGGLNVLTNIHCVLPWLGKNGDKPQGTYYSTVELNFNIVAKGGRIIESHPLLASLRI